MNERHGVEHTHAKIKGKEDISRSLETEFKLLIGTA